MTRKGPASVATAEAEVPPELLKASVDAALGVYESAYFAFLNAEEAFTLAKANLRDIGENLVPEALDAAGIKQAHLPTLGYPVMVDSDAHYGIAVADRDAAIQWLVDNGHEELTKLEISVGFGLRKKDLANAAYKTIKETLSETAEYVEAGRTIPGPTMKKFIIERLRRGEPLPEFFGVYVRRFANIIVPKPEKVNETP